MSFSFAQSVQKKIDVVHLEQVRLLRGQVSLHARALIGMMLQLAELRLAPVPAQLKLVKRGVVGITKRLAGVDAVVMSQFKGVAGGKLNVAVICAGDDFFPRLLVEFAHRHVDVTFDFGVHNREELLAEPAENRTDLAIRVRPPEAADVDTVNVPCAPHPYVIVAASDHLARARK